MIFETKNSNWRIFPIVLLALALWIDTLPILPISWQSLPGRVLVSCVFAYLWLVRDAQRLSILFVVGLCADILHDRTYGETPLFILLLFIIINLQRSHALLAGSLSYIFFLATNTILVDLVALAYNYFVNDVVYTLIGMASGWASCVALGCLWYIPLRIIYQK